VTPFIPQIPQAIADAQTGNFATIAKWYALFNFDDSVSWGMFESVQCAEDAAFVTQQQVLQAGQSYPSVIQADATQQIVGEFSACQLWQVAPASASFKAPVTSDIPTLVLEDAYDPITPPANGDAAAKTLSHSYVMHFPGTGHGAYLTGICPLSIVNAFFADPTTAPNSGCIGGMGEPAFT
jgi:pimeloyl-ACP methyl ester carboxylesterase